MSTVAIYALIPIITIAIPLASYRYSTLIIFGAAIGEAATLLLLYGSTFMTCSADAAVCGSTTAIPAVSYSLAAMNLGMIWPIIAGYAKREKLEKEKLNAGTGTKHVDGIDEKRNQP